MLMGKLVSNKKYEMYEYVVAILITIGMVGFFYGSEDMPAAGNKTATTTFSGIILLVLSSPDLGIIATLRGPISPPISATYHRQ